MKLTGKQLLVLLSMGFLIMLCLVFWSVSTIEKKGKVISTKFDIVSTTARDLQIELEKREIVNDALETQAVQIYKENKNKDSVILKVTAEKNWLNTKVNEQKRLIDSLKRLVGAPKRRAKKSDIDFNRYDKNRDTLQ